MRPRVTYRIVLQQLSLINEELRRLGDRTRLIIAPGGNASVLKFLVISELREECDFNKAQNWWDREKKLSFSKNMFINRN